MKTAAPYVLAFTALSVIVLTFILVTTGALNPFYLRAIIGLVIVVFIALLTIGE